MALLRAAAEELHTVAAREVAWWDRFDLNGGNIMVAADGQPKVVDIFRLDGQSLYDALLYEPDLLRQRIPAARRRHMADIGHIARVCGVAELA